MELAKGCSLADELLCMLPRESRDANGRAVAGVPMSDIKSDLGMELDAQVCRLIEQLERRGVSIGTAYIKGLGRVVFVGRDDWAKAKKMAADYWMITYGAAAATVQG